MKVLFLTVVELVHVKLFFCMFHVLQPYNFFISFMLNAAPFLSVNCSIETLERRNDGKRYENADTCGPNDCDLLSISCPTRKVSGLAEIMLSCRRSWEIGVHLTNFNIVRQLGNCAEGIQRFLLLWPERTGRNDTFNRLFIHP